MKKKSIARLATEYALAKFEADQAAKAKAEAEALLIDAMIEANVPTVVVPDQYGGEFRGTVVRGQTVSTDFEALGRVLPGDIRKEVQTTVTYVDKDKVEAMVALGKIKAEQVADVSEVKNSKPYVKVTGIYDVETLGKKRS